MYIPKAAEEFTYDADGNLTGDSVWTYAWDAENRLKSVQMRDEVAEVLLHGDDPWLRLEFDYDSMHRRIAKRVISTLLTPQEMADAIAQGKIYYGKSRWTRYLYDTGTFNLVMSYHTHWQTGAYQTADRSYPCLPRLQSSSGWSNRVKSYYSQALGSDYRGKPEFIAGRDMKNHCSHSFHAPEPSPVRCV